MVRSLSLVLVGTILAFLAATEIASAQVQGGAPAAPSSSVDETGIISKIVIEGNQRIEAETIQSYLSIAAGDPFNAARINASIKSLFDTGLFADISFNRQGNDLVIRVVENPIVNRVAFEGNHHVETKDMQTEVQLKPRVVYNQTKVTADVQRLLELYRRNARFAATVEPKIIKLPQNRVDVVFEINEGPATYVTRIAFIGNRHFSDSELRDVMSTKEELWWRLFADDDSYDPDRLNYDRELLRRFYLSRGYADFRVVSAVADLSPDRTRFFITITLDEGPRYHFGKIDLVNSIPDLKTEDLRRVITAKRGNWFNSDEIQNTQDALSEAAGDKSYAFVNVKPIINRDAPHRLINVTFDLEQAQRVYIGRINIEGNVRTLDKVIRREMLLVEGDAFSASKMKRSKQRINDLNFFKSADITNQPSDTAPDRTDLNVKIEEKSTGDLSLGVGWSTSYGPLVSVGAHERNLLGRGDDLSANVSFAVRQTLAQVGFTEPYLFDRHLIAGADLFSSNDKLNQIVDYNTGTAGGDLRMGYYYNEYLRHDWTYLASETNIHNIQAGASEYIFQQAGVTTLSQFSHVLTWDKRDSKVKPTTGYYIRAGNDVAGALGDNHFIRTSIGAGQYFKLAPNYVLSVAGQTSYIAGLGPETLRINQRLYLGGANLRGFREAGVSPLDKVSLDPLGAIWDYSGSVQLTFPSGLPKELDVQGKVFSDFGGVGPTVSSIPKSTVETSNMTRVSLGVGMIWTSPFGPIDVDFAYPIVREPYDEIKIFRFNFGTRF